MPFFCSALQVLTIAACLYWNHTHALLCRNGGTCAERTADECTSCTCMSGFIGVDCGAVLIKAIGSVTFTGTNASVFNETGFKDRVSDIFIGYESSSVQIRNSASVSVVDFTVNLERSSELISSNKAEFQNNTVMALIDEKTSRAAFVNSGNVSVSSATVDIDECASDLQTCMENAECYNTATEYGCSCKTGYSQNNQTCREIYCLLSLAPRWPSSASRNVTFPPGMETKYSDSDKVPYKTFIEYTCPARFSLVNDDTGETQAEVIECVGKDQPTHNNNGWSGNNVRCDMTTEFTIAIVAAVVSSAIIVLVGGGIIVCWTNEKKEKAKLESDRVALEMENNF